MSRTTKLLAGLLLAGALCVPAAAASAAPAPAPVTAAPIMTADLAAAVQAGTVVVLSPDTSGASARKRDKWKGGVVWNSVTDSWMAMVTKDGSGYAWGGYSTKDEAQAEADEEADYNNQNGFVPGPGCSLPLVLC